MQSNYFDSTILGTISNGQGIVNAVEGTHRAALRVLAFARRHALRLGGWRALSIKRMAAAATMTPAMATCPSQSDSRRQRSQRWVPVVVVDSGTVGVS